MLISVMFFLIISLALVVGFANPVAREFRVAGDIFNSKQAYFLAESGIEEAYYRIQNGLDPTLMNGKTLTLNGSTTTISVCPTACIGTQKVITSQSDVFSGQRKVSLTLDSGDGVTFHYGTIAGDGGINFKNNSYLRGDLYSNGNIVGSNGAYVTGTVIVAGATGSIDGMCIGVGNGTSCTLSGTAGSAYAHSITNSDVKGDAYYSSTYTGTKASEVSCPNSHCHSGSADYPPLAMPISDTDITNWKSDASTTVIDCGVSPTPSGCSGGTYTVSSAKSLGPVKIIGNLAVNSTLTVTNTIYATGNITFSSGSTTKLDATVYGGTTKKSGIIIADGRIKVSNGASFTDYSANSGSFIMILTTSTADDSAANGNACGGTNAITICNNADIVVANAQQGSIFFSNNATVKEIQAKTIRLWTNVGIIYGSGLINIDFTSGPSASWVISKWEETQ